MPEPSAGPVVEFEGLLHIFFSEHGNKADVLAAIDAAHQSVEQRCEESEGISESYLEGAGAFPDRLPWLVVSAAFLQEMIDAVERWADWAQETVEAWPDDIHRATPDLTALKDMAENATARRQSRRS